MARLAAVVGLAQDGVGAEADAAEVWVVVAVHSGQGRCPRVGDGDGYQLLLVVIAKFQRLAAAGGEKLLIAGYINQIFVALFQATDPLVQIEQSHSLLIHDGPADSHFEQLVSLPPLPPLRLIGPEEIHV